MSSAWASCIGASVLAGAAIAAFGDAATVLVIPAMYLLGWYLGKTEGFLEGKIAANEKIVSIAENHFQTKDDK
jgi:hypothetical protein